MSTKRTSSAFMTSVVIHIIIALAAGLYLLSQTQEFKNLIGVDILQPSKPPTPPRPPHMVKPPIQSTVREHNPVTEELAPAAKRDIITSSLRSGVQPQNRGTDPTKSPYGGTSQRAGATSGHTDRVVDFRRSRGVRIFRSGRKRPPHNL